MPTEVEIATWPICVLAALCGLAGCSQDRTPAPVLSEPPVLPLVGKTVAVDPGHNGGNAAHASEIARRVWIGNGYKECDTTGTATNSGYAEASYNFDVAQRLSRLLKVAGASVVLTRNSNRGWGPCIDRRARIGNRAEADAAISIHADGGPAGGRGFHVIYPERIRGLSDDIASQSHTLALRIRAAYRRGTEMPYSTYLGTAGLNERGDLGGLNLSNVPKVFIETGNMRNAIDARRLQDPRFRQRAAQSIESGLERFLISSQR